MLLGETLEEQTILLPSVGEFKKKGNSGPGKAIPKEKTGRERRESVTVLLLLSAQSQSTECA